MTYRFLDVDLRRAALPLAGCLLALTLTALPSPAEACGGLFCAAPPPTPAPAEPVDQNAERIIFEVLPGEVVAHVQIQYMGDADDFAWIVPVPAVPEVGESSDDLFLAVDGQTAPTVQLPQAEPCQPQAVAGDTGGGCGCSDEAGGTGLSADGGNRGVNNASNNGVIVYDRDYTDNFEFVVVGAEDTMTLVTWLQDEGYNVSDNMTPVMDPYNGANGKFLALKLRAGKEASDIVPIKMRYEADKPMVPIQLTAVAAQPLMGIQVFIVADQPYAPENYDLVRPDTSQILFDADSNTNYFAWVARAAAEEGGQLFVEEYAGAFDRPSATTQDQEEKWLDGSGTMVTRLYTRMSPQHMTVDPVFAPHPNGAGHRAEATLDLTDKPSLYRCQAVIVERIPSPCAFNYCGVDSECVEVDGAAACRCPDGQISQSIMGPMGVRRVTCAPAVNPVGVLDDDAMAGTEFDPCNGWDCGDGSCMLKGGFPACMCDAGAASTTRDDGRVTCQMTAPEVPTFGPGGGAESAPEVSAVTRQPARPWMVGLVAPFLVVLAARRWFL